MFRMIQARLRAFRDETRGSVSIEAVLMVPILFWAFAAMYVFFDAYRQSSVNTKAAYTISDMLSRETQEITPTYISNTKKLFDLLTVQDPGETGIRVSVLRWKEDHKKPQVVWSEARGDASSLSNNDIRDWADRLPLLKDKEQVIVVETFMDYEAPFDIGLPDRTIETFVFTRPRFAPQVLWSDT